ncbi:MAG: EscU/YscU/HrcU family type III secretion system export apparatus switch protein [Planctomycetes bacterium]|nr:EscU/YscU/HrcU family type III secretion system export apparatus switch protein [Planctomycetota bacterium]
MTDFRFEERTEPASPRRRREARERGQVARSADLTFAVVATSAAGAAWLWGRSLATAAGEGVGETWGNLHRWCEGNADPVGEIGRRALGMGWAALPWCAAVVAAALAAGWLQAGFLFTAEPVAPRFERLDPAAGLRRLCSIQALLRVVAALLKGLAVIGVLALTLWEERLRLLALPHGGTADLAAWSAGMAGALAWRMALALLALGLLDWAYQRWRYEADLKMSKTEAREEKRQDEGRAKRR